MVCAKHTIGSKIILDTSDGTPRWEGSSESSVHLEIVLILMQDRCMLCVQRIIGLEIVLDSPVEHLSDVGPVEFRFFPFADGASVSAR
jgi:hypothetical protein